MKQVLQCMTLQKVIVEYLKPLAFNEYKIND